MKIFLGFLFQFSIHQEIGVAKNILIGLRTHRYYVWLLIYHLFSTRFYYTIVGLYIILYIYLYNYLLPRHEYSYSL